MKLKEWNFEKYVPASQMRILVAKAEKRAREENKETVFFNGETQIDPQRFSLFKKRKSTKEADAASPSAGMSSPPEEDRSELILEPRNAGEYYLPHTRANPSHTKARRSRRKLRCSNSVERLGYGCYG
jgi:hypothetical protein